MCVTTLLFFFGMLAYAHSIELWVIISRELQAFPAEKEVDTSNTTAYNLKGIGQI